MNRSTSLKRLLLRYAALSLTYFLFAGLSFSMIQRFAITNDRYGIVAIHEGTAHNPFARRVLMPSVGKLVHAAIPETLRSRIDQLAPRIREPEDFRTDSQRVSGLLERIGGRTSIVVVAMFLNYLSLVAFLFALRYAMHVFFHPPDILSNFLPLLSLLLLPVFGMFDNFIYDYPTLVLFTLGLTFMANRRWRYYYVVFILATLNKETAILLPIVFLMAMRKQMRRREYWSHLLAQGGAYVTTLALLVWLFRDRPGGLVEYHLDFNVAAVSSVHTFLLFKEFGPCLLFPSGLPISVPVGPNILVWGPVALLVLAFWSEKPFLLRVALPVMLVIVGSLMFFMGLVIEIRAGYEAFPAVCLLMFYSLARICGMRSQPRPEG